MVEFCQVFIQMCTQSSPKDNQMTEFWSIIPLCNKHVVAKVNLVPCTVNLTGKRDKVDHQQCTDYIVLITTVRQAAVGIV